MAAQNRYYRGPISDHFDGTRFLNPAGEPETDRSLGDLLHWRRTAPDNPWPAAVEISPIVPEARVDGLRVTMIGHATLLIQVGGLNLLTDPVFSDRASPFSFAGPRRITVPGVALDALPPIDAILLSHNHYDHLDLASLRRLVADHDPLIVTPLGNDAIIRRRLAAARVEAGDWGDAVAIGPDAHAHIVPALHWSSRGPRDRRMALWGGFVIEAAGRRVYFAGDTGYGTGRIFRDIGARFGPIDVAIVPIGAYDPRWFMAAQHCNPEEAVRIVEDVGAKAGIGMHWGTFKLTDEACDEPRDRLVAELLKRGKDPEYFVAMRPADVADFNHV